jgi:hypothetical protein
MNKILSKALKGIGIATGVSCTYAVIMCVLEASKIVDSEGDYLLSDITFAGVYIITHPITYLKNRKTLTIEELIDRGVEFDIKCDDFVAKLRK